ncbi:heterokaryon incompatibility protein-domain-containing protein [Podospora didyma]|uniref:Heterokaryon incompatibility protein-domain-containing protein n=1 Tax=Podospora didyma TaxID=330526 RepID=A0AAE0NHS8_9PEZI|nr:heterokaryon incompatibility protein-domain-containing protein [Podospora didyma]
MEVYKTLYESVLLGGDAVQSEIRLLHVFPSTEEDDPIRCTLSVHILTPTLEFTALSYEWGRPFKPTEEHPAPTLEVNDLAVPVQPNLYHALRHLRENEAEGLVIWVDAICINQKNDEEKAQQVGLMAELYGLAGKTFAWIGVRTKDSDVAMATLERVGWEMLLTKSGKETLGGKSGGSEGDGGTEERPTSALEEFQKLTAGAAAGEWNLQARDELLKLVPDLMREYLPGACFPVSECRGLLSREYWSRMWIQQEIVLSSNVVVCCGHCKVSWDVFEAGIVFIMLLMHHAVYGVISKYTNKNGGMVWDFSKWTDSERKNYELLSPGWSAEASALRRLRRRYSQRRSSSSSSTNEFSLVRLITEAHSNPNVRYEVSWHEDRIYGLAGMAADITYLQRFGFKVAYDVPCTDVYTNLARSIILSGGVDLLALSSFTKVERMPSWAPDWRIPVRIPRCGFPWESQFCATKGLHGPENIGTRKFRPENTGHQAEWDDPLVLTGCVVDVVDHTNSPWRPGDVGCRLQPRQTLGYLLDLQNIIWMAGERQKKLENPIYSASDANTALFSMPVANQLQGGTSIPPEGRTEYLANGYLGVMKDLDRNFIFDTRLWVGFRASFGVKFEGFPDPGDMKTPPPIKDSTAEFNTKDSYYNMMNRQSGTRPFVGDKGYMGLVPDVAEKGDVIVIFRGAKFPYVLRKKVNGKHGGMHELVGEAYVHGVMYGEYVAEGPEWQRFELV